jgi:hypothetical protein
LRRCFRLRLEDWPALANNSPARLGGAAHGQLVPQNINTENWSARVLSVLRFMDQEGCVHKHRLNANKIDNVLMATRAEGVDPD